MGTRKCRGKSKVKDCTPIKDVLTHNNSTLKALFTSNRRMGLGRKKLVHNSQSIIPELKIENETTSILATTIEHCEGFSTSQSTSSSPKPNEKKQKGSASRRKKSRNPLKRTIDDTIKLEGKPFQVYVTPIPNKRKIISKDICTSDTNSLISTKLNEILVYDNISNNIKNKFMNNENMTLPNNDTGQVNVYSSAKTSKKLNVKVSLPLKMSKKRLNTLTKLIKSDKNNLSVLTSDEKLTVKDKKSVEVKTKVNIKTCESTKSLINVPNSNVNFLETKTIKKRKVHEKNNKISENMTKKVKTLVNDNVEIVVHTKVINNPSEMIILNNVHKEEPVNIKEQGRSSKQMKKILCAPIPKTNSKSSISNNKNKILNLNKSFQKNDDNFHKDFRDVTPRNKKKIRVKKKKLVEPKILVKNSKNEKLILDTCNKQINEINKKNTKRKVKNKNVSKNIELIAEEKTYGVILPLLSVVKSKQLKSTNDNRITGDKINVEINVSSDLNNTGSSNFSDLIRREKESATDSSEAKKKDVILNNNEVKLTPSSSEHEGTIENIKLRIIELPVIKNKAEKKSYDTDIPLLSKNCTVENLDEKSTAKIISPDLLLKNDIKSKIDDELSYNDDSCESSHYSTPVYSPIEKTAKLSNDKDLVIQNCDEILSPYQQSHIIYECHKNNSQSPEKNVEKKSVCVNECVSSFVEPSTNEDVNVELNLKEIKEKVVCETFISINNEKNQLIDDLLVLIQEKQPDKISGCEIDDSSIVLPVLENNLEITTKDEISSNKRELPILKRHEILLYTPKMLRNSQCNIERNTIHNRVSSTLKLNKTLLKEEVNTGGKDLKRANVSEIVLADKTMSLIEKIEEVSISGKVAQEKVEDKICKPGKKIELLNYYPRVLINIDDILNYYKDHEMGRKKPDEEIHRVNKISVIRRTYEKGNTTPKTQKLERKNSDLGKTISNDINFDAHIYEKNIVISRAENYVTNNTKKAKSKRIKNNKEIEKHTESVFFTPPSSRSENDSFGEGTSKQGVFNTSDITSTSKLTNLISTVTRQKEIIIQEDCEVASILERSTLRKREKLKQKRKTILPQIRNTHATSNVNCDSEDNFKMPKSQLKHISSKNFLIKNDSDVKCIIKNKSYNRLENFHLTDNSSLTAIHRGLCLEYAKSNNTYNTNTKSDETYTNKSLIQNRCSYFDHKPILSIFDSVVDDPESYVRSQETPSSRTITNPLKRDVLFQIKEIEQRIKKKSTSLERLNLINIYKKKNNFENLSKATIQMTKGAQEALLELAAVLRQRSETPFDMGTLLDNMAIPHHVVGYNIELDEFT